MNSYDDYGIPGASNWGRFQYTGQAWIPDLGMYYYKARFYSPTLGRFMQTDPVGYDDQINLYAYVGNDPINGTDPSGMIDVSNTCSLSGKGSSCSGSYPGSVPTPSLPQAQAAKTNQSPSSQTPASSTSRGPANEESQEDISIKCEALVCIPPEEAPLIKCEGTPCKRKPESIDCSNVPIPLRCPGEAPAIRMPPVQPINWCKVADNVALGSSYVTAAAAAARLIPHPVAKAGSAIVGSVAGGTSTVVTIVSHQAGCP